ncbi:MAG: hypothetical protein WA710_03145, partial [Pseudolabrys sp.]
MAYLLDGDIHVARNLLGHSAVMSSITPINQATKYLRRRAVLEIPPRRERLACQFRWYGTRH